MLLELLDSAWNEWLVQLDEDLAVVDPNVPPAERGDQLAAALASSLASRPVLCDLISAQAAVLEHNLSAKVAAEYKRAAIANVVSLAQLVVGRLPVRRRGGHGDGSGVDARKTIGRDARRL